MKPSPTSERPTSRPTPARGGRSARPARSRSPTSPPSSACSSASPACSPSPPRRFSPMPHADTVIIGAGQAGLALSRQLSLFGHDHVVLEQGRVGERWRSERWDSLALLTPNWANRLPGDASAADPDAYLSRTEFVLGLDRYARSFGAPVRENTTVLSMSGDERDFTVRTNRGNWTAASVVIASGDCAVPSLPWFAASVPTGVEHLHASRYARPDSLPAGGVLVV